MRWRCGRDYALPNLARYQQQLHRHLSDEAPAHVGILKEASLDPLATSERRDRDEWTAKVTLDCIGMRHATITVGVRRVLADSFCRRAPRRVWWRAAVGKRVGWAQDLCATLREEGDVRGREGGQAERLVWRKCVA